jgi:Fe-Mn family superoxide dismutase
MPTLAKSTYQSYEIKNKFKPGALDGFSEKMIDQHWMLYKGYVTNVNLLNKTIWDCLEENKELNEPKMAEVLRRRGFEYNGMVLHELYFEALKKGVPKPSGSSDLYKKLADDFGGFDRWQKQFIEIGKMRGVGWVLTSYEPSTRRLINSWVSDHEIGHIAGFTPIIAMDVWEHAFVGDYGPSADGRAKYIEAYFKNLSWDVIAKRLDATSQNKSIGEN